MNFIKKNKLIVFIAILFALNCLVWYATISETPGKLEVAFLNVGQGDAIFIETPDKNKILIDGGPDKSVLRELGKVLPFYDKKIDTVIITHPDQDHIGGLPVVLENYSVGAVLEPGSTSDGAEYKEVEKLIARKNIKKYFPERGMSLSSEDGAVMEILFPFEKTEGWETNTSSIVSKLSYGDESFIFTGDSPKEVLSYLASAYGTALKSSVLKVGHHGSRNSLSESFFGAVSPEYSIISAGKDNRYGHPHKEVLDALQNINSKILETFRDKRIVFETDGEQLVVNGF